MECGNGFTGKVEWAGWDIYRWVAGGGGVICWWDTGRVYYWVEYVSGIMGGLFVTYNGNRWVRVIIVTYIYCAIF